MLGRQFHTLSDDLTEPFPGCGSDKERMVFAWVASCCADGCRERISTCHGRTRMSFLVERKRGRPIFDAAPTNQLSGSYSIREAICKLIRRLYLINSILIVTSSSRVPFIKCNHQEPNPDTNPVHRWIPLSWVKMHTEMWDYLRDNLILMFGLCWARYRCCLVKIYYLLLGCFGILGCREVHLSDPRNYYQVDPLQSYGSSTGL